MAKRKLTRQDFDNNPILPELGLSIGDEVEVPETTTDDTEDDDTGGSNPPPNKERP